MKPTTELTNKTIETARCSQTVDNSVRSGGLRMRTDLRAGLAWDDVDDQAQQLWSNLTGMLSGLTGSSDQS